MRLSNYHITISKEALLRQFKKLPLLKAKAMAES